MPYIAASPSVQEWTPQISIANAEHKPLNPPDANPREFSWAMGGMDHAVQPGIRPAPGGNPTSRSAAAADLFHGLF